MTVQSVVAAISDGAVYETVTLSFGTPSSNPVIGEPAILAGADSGNGNLLVAQKATLPQAATLQSLSFYVTAAAGKLRLGLYDSTGPSGGPGKLLAAPPEITPVLGWNTIGVAATVLPIGDYWLAYFPSDNGLGFRNQQSGAAQWRALSYGAMPATFSASPISAQAYHWSFYATFMAGTIVIPSPVYAGPFNVAPNPPPPPPPPPSTGFGLIRSKTSHTTGSWYFEMIVNKAANLAHIGIGIDNNSESLTAAAGKIGSICWLGDGTVDYNGIIGAYIASPFSVGDVLGIDADLTGKTIRFRVNGGAFSSNFSISAIAGGAMFAFAQLTNNLDQITANFIGKFAFTATSTAWG